MSQSGSFGYEDTPILSITGDVGGVITPDALQNINLIGGTNITITGDLATNSFTFNVSEDAEGTGQTIGAVSDDIITLALGTTPGVYEISIRVTAFESTTTSGGGYRVNAAVRTTGATAVLIGLNAIDVFEEAALAGCAVSLVASGNNAIVRVTGVAGLTIDWSAELNTKFGG
jgi:hypothetical protein